MVAALNIDIPKDFKISVLTTQNRGFTPEEVAARCADKIVSVSESAHPAIREQALAFKMLIERVLVHYIKEAVASDRTTLYNALKDAGHPEMAELIRRF